MPSYRHWISRRASWFTPLRAEVLLSGINAPGAGNRQLKCLLSRALLRYQVIELIGVPAAKHAAAVALQVRQLSPFADTEYFTAVHGDLAFIWMWNATQVAAMAEKANIKLSRISWIPESFLHPPFDGQRVVRCLDGFEGQYWRDGVLTNSRAWAHEPNESDWQAFLRDSGSEALVPVPRPVSVTLTAEGWAKPISLPHAGVAFFEPAAVMAGSALLAGTALWLGAQWLQLNDSLAAQAGRLAMLEQQIEPVQVKRHQALAQVSRIEVLQKLDLYPEQAILLAELGRRLPKDGSFVREWDFQGDKLRVVLASAAKLPATTWVTQMQESGWFKDVQAVTGNSPNALTLEMTVNPRSATPTASMFAKSVTPPTPPATAPSAKAGT